MFSAWSKRDEILFLVDPGHLLFKELTAAHFHVTEDTTVVFRGGFFESFELRSFEQ